MDHGVEYFVPDFCFFLDSMIAGERAAKRIKLSTNPLGEQTPLGTKGAFVNVGQKNLAGFSSKESLLYVRDETIELWDALNDTGDNSLSIDGPPGTGKSTEAWAWALWKAKNDNVTVTWYHLTKNELVKVVVDGSTCEITTGYEAEIKDINASEGSILIVDGVTASKNFDVRSACCNWRRSELGRIFILVSSLSVAIALQENQEAKIVDFTVGSWTFKQYQDACANEDFFGNVIANLRCPGLETVNDKDELLLSKYYFAGGCARWMFEFNYMQWQLDINTHLGKVLNYALLLGGGGGDQASDAVNHLRGVTVLTTKGIKEKKYFFISQYAAGALAMKCDDKRKFLVDSYAKAADTLNPAFRGWIFEFDIEYQLDKAQRDKSKFCSEIRSPTGGPPLTEEKRSVDAYMEFDSVSDLSDAFKSLSNGNVLWAKPKLWCQKAYDFLCLWINPATNSLNLVVVNATLAQKHSVLLNGVKKLAVELHNNACDVTAIRFEFIVPKDAAFTVGKITGRLCDWNNLDTDSNKWPNDNSPAVYLENSFITVAEVVQTS